ncbi:MAG: extracellular solute-binding protein [Chloroflexota bacterium]
MRIPTRMLFLLIMICMLVLAGCPAAAPTDSAAESQESGAADGKVTIEVWIGQSDFAACIEETIIGGFNAQSDNIFVETVKMEDVWGTARPAIAGGEGPDVVTTPGPSFVFELVQAGQLLSLEGASDLHNWGETFASFALDLGRVDGELYSLPDEMETLVVYYNKTVFEEQGWDIPTTMAELHALAAVANDAGFIPFSHANADWRPSNEWFVGEYFNHVAGPDKVHQALTDQIPWTDPDFVTAIDLLNEAQQNGWWMGGLEFYYTTSGDDRRTALATGEAVMNIEGSWAVRALHEDFFVEETGGNDWDWFPMPTTEGDAVYSVGMGNTSSINGNTEHPEEAAAYLAYAFSPAVQAQAFVDCGKQPAPVVIPEGTITGKDERVARLFETLGQAVADGDYGYTTWTFWPPKSDVYIYEEIEKVWAGDMTSEEYLQGLDTLFQEEFDAGEIPPIPDR